MSVGIRMVLGSGSHHIHGDWYEISVYHLDREGRYYTPNLSFADPDPRLTCSLTHICLRTLLTYLGMEQVRSR